MRYPGGKGRCFKHLISLMGAHDTYIETHLGGGAAMRQKKPAKRNIGIEIDSAVVAAWRAEPKPACEILQGDAVELLRTFRFEGNELVYSDPPYLRSTRRKQWIYRHDYEVADHIQLLEVLKQLPCAVMISGYRNSLYDQMLADWRSVEIPGDSHTGPRVEVVWMNYPEPAVLHDVSHVGGDFRARELIKRRRNGLVRRIGGLHNHERHALFERLAAEHGDELRRVLGGAP